ncbi:Snf7 family [Mrakia frigida]|uniref:Vps60p n=1 Tax=Mrakia frigida TaxID=29902 RepID=UPI003FCC2193
MNRLFGNSKATPKPTLTDAIASTDTRIGTIEVKVRKLDAELGRYRDQMAKMREGPGKGAIQKRAIGVLKQKRMYEQQLQQLQQQTFNMEQASMTTENLRNTMATVDAMKSANKEMKKQYKGIDIDKIESIHYDMEDLIDQANEIQESLGRSYGVPDEIDESDLQAELDALADEGYAEEESEGQLPSYLRDSSTHALPDFVDSDPISEHPTSAQPEAAR